MRTVVFYKRYAGKVKECFCFLSYKIRIFLINRSTVLFKHSSINEFNEYDGIVNGQWLEWLLKGKNTGERLVYIYYF